MASKFEGNFLSAKSIDRELVSVAVSAIRDPSKWDRVLDAIIARTPATAAIITLRDSQTCQIVNDDELEKEYHSPLIRGFSLDAVVHYLTELRTIDPWANAQRTHYPHRPTLMSKILARGTTEEQPFFDWLKREDKADTIAFELERMSGYWTAFNLFLPSRDPADAEAALAYTEAHYDLLREAWQSSQDMINNRQVNDAVLRQFSNLGVAVAVIDTRGCLRHSNTRFEDIVNVGAIRLNGPDQRVSFSANLTIDGFDKDKYFAIRRHQSNASEFNITASPFEPDPLYQGKREKLWLLTIMSNVESSEIRQFNAQSLVRLTPQEARLFNAVQDGHSVTDAGESIGVRRSRAFDIWGSVKTKLAITNSHQVRHRLR